MAHTSPLTAVILLSMLSGAVHALPAQAPPPETIQFARLAGEWDVRFWPRDSTGIWAEEPVAATWSWRVILGGHAVQDFWTQPGETPGSWARGTNLRIYDPEMGEWRVRWTASDDRRFMALTARQEGDSLRVFGTHASGRPLRITFFDMEPNRFRWTMEVGDGQDGWIPWSRLEAQRRGPGDPLPRNTPTTGSTPSPMPGDIELRVLVEGEPSERLEAWLDSERVDRFFAASSTIEPHTGGRYEIRFLTGDEAEARANSTLGSRILALEPGRHLAFQWRVPPWAAEAVRSAPPTRVDIRMERADDPAGRGRTVLHLRHSGFGEGPAWDEVRRFFQRNWFEILDRYREIVGRRAGDRGA